MPETDSTTGNKVKDYSYLDNYASPLVGQFLNLPNKSTVIRCPACGFLEESYFEKVLTPKSETINALFSCLFISFCLCWCVEYRLISRKFDGNHYCQNCGCYFGRYLEKKKHLNIEK